MPYARNAVDGTAVYFEDDGGSGAPVLLYGGILDSVESVRASQLAQALQEADEFRLVYVDHRGLGRSDKPHDIEAYAMALQVGDFDAVMSAIGVARAHVLGRSYGGRLVFGIGAHAPERVLSLVAGGQQPYAINLDGPLIRALSTVLEATRRDGAVRFVEALEGHWGEAIPAAVRDVYVSQDGVAVAAAFEAMLRSGDVTSRLGDWRVACLIYLGAGDEDFFEQASRAASEIPGAEFISLAQLDHLSAHYEAGSIAPAVLRTLRANSAR